MSKFKLRITGDLGFEVWQDIPGYEGLYQASTYGRVKSLKRNTTSGKILKPRLKKTGYFQYGLCKNGRIKAFESQRLIAITFLPNYHNYSCVNHIDENPKNNRVDNLEWCTVKYNVNYGTRIERARLLQINNPKKSKTVLQFDMEGNFISSYPSTAEVERQKGYNSGYISICCIGKKQKAYGFIWKYA